MSKFKVGDRIVPKEGYSCGSWNTETSKYAVITKISGAGTYFHFDVYDDMGAATGKCFMCFGRPGNCELYAPETLGLVEELINEGETTMSDTKPTAVELAVKKKLGEDNFTLYQHGIITKDGDLTPDGQNLINSLILDEYKADLLALISPVVEPADPTASA